MNRNKNILVIGSAFALVVLLIATLGVLAFALDALPASAAEPIRSVLNLEDDDAGEQPITGEALDQASAAALEYTGGGRVTDTEVGDEDGYYEVEVTLDDGSQVDVHLDESFNVLGEEADRDESEDEDEAEDALEAGDADEDEAEGEDTPITGEALDRASAAALEYLGDGRVTDTEVGDEEGYYEIEVTLDDGSQVDVHLDENFNILGQEAETGSDND